MSSWYQLETWVLAVQMNLFFYVKLVTTVCCMKNVTQEYHLKSQIKYFSSDILIL